MKIKIFLLIFAFLTFDVQASDFRSCKNAIKGASVIGVADNFYKIHRNLLDYSVSKSYVSDVDITIAMIFAEKSKAISNSFIQTMNLFDLHGLMLNEKESDRQLTYSFIKPLFVDMAAAERTFTSFLDYIKDVALRRELLDLVVALRKSSEIISSCS